MSTPESAQGQLSTIGHAHTEPGVQAPTSSGMAGQLARSCPHRISSLQTGQEPGQHCGETQDSQKSPCLYPGASCPLPQILPGLHSPSVNLGHHGRTNSSAKHATLRSLQEEHAQASPICRAQHSVRRSPAWQPISRLLLIGSRDIILSIKPHPSHQMRLKGD